MFQKPPDDPFFEEMDEFQYYWMLQNWLADQEEQHKTYHEYSTYIGAFSNPQMADKAFKAMSNDNVIASSEKEFEESFQNVINSRENNSDLNQSNSISNRRRRRRKILPQ